MVGIAKAQEQGMRVGGDAFCLQIFVNFFLLFVTIFFYNLLPFPGCGRRGGASLAFEHTSMVQAEVANHFQQVDAIKPPLKKLDFLFSGDPGTTHRGWREGRERIPVDLEGGGKLPACLEERGDQEVVEVEVEEGGQGVTALLEEIEDPASGWEPHVQSLQCPAWPQRS